MALDIFWRNKAKSIDKSIKISSHPSIRGKELRRGWKKEGEYRVSLNGGVPDTSHDVSTDALSRTPKMTEARPETIDSANGILLGDRTETEVEDVPDGVVYSKRACLRANKKLVLFFAAIFLVIIVILIILLAVLLGNATTNDSRGLDRDTYFSPRGVALPDADAWAIDDARFLNVLTDALRIKTISYGDERDANLTSRLEFGEFLKTAFPLIHNASIVTLKVYGGASLLYEVKGTTTVKPYMLISHLDVVPADNADSWDKDPFSGETADGYLYGRGTLDIKSSIIGIMAAIETRLSQDPNWQPSRTLFAFFGHDEETGGMKGAKVAAEALKQSGVELEFILDEGAAMTLGFFPGVDRPVGLIGVAEKGYVSVEMESVANAGHSSMPREKSAIGNLARALTALEDNPLPYHFEQDDINREPFEWIAPYLSFANRVAMSNLWLFKYAVLSKLTETPETRAMARTTTAFTVVSGGVKDNVLPKRATALVNHRLHPGDNSDVVLEWDRRVTKEISGISLRIKPGWHNSPSPIAPHGENDATYHVIKSSIHSVFEDSIVVPYITVGGTDSKHFVGLTENIYRFVPYVLDKKLDDTKRIHGVNERIKTSDFSRFIRFYMALIQLADNI